MRKKITLIIALLILLNVFSGCSYKESTAKGDYTLVTSSEELLGERVSDESAINGYIVSFAMLGNNVYVVYNNQIAILDSNYCPIELYSPQGGRQISSIACFGERVYSFETDGVGTILVTIKFQENQIVEMEETVIEQNKIVYKATAFSDFVVAIFDSEISVYDFSGKAKFTIKAAEPIINISTDSTGKSYVLALSANSPVLYYLDTVAKRLVKITSLPKAITSCDIYYSEGQYDLLYRSDNNLWGIAGETRQMILIADLMESDIDPISVRAVLTQTGDRTICLTSNNSLSESFVYALSLSAVPTEKQTLTLAVFNMDNLSQFLVHVAEYNRANPNYRIKVVQYGSNDGYYSYGWMDSTEGVDKFALDVAAGNIPDIIDVSTLRVESLASKGFLEDLYTYIESDSELSREDFYPNLLAAMEIDGRLFNTLSFFSIATAYTDKFQVGKNLSITYEQAVAAYKKSGLKYFLNVSGKSFLTNVFCSYYVDEFVDIAAGSCSFDSPRFIDYLKMLKMMPSGPEFDENPGAEPENCLLVQTSLNPVMLRMESLPLWQGDFSYVGMPSEDGSRGLICSGGVQLAISSASKYKDAAWDFVRTMLTEKYQNDFSSFVSMRSNIASQNNTYEHILALLEDDEEARATFEKRYAMLMDIFYSSRKIQSIDYALYNIIVEEALAYLAGDKTAEETAAVIQSRASIYVAEQR